jgi:hypothetical protein
MSLPSLAGDVIDLLKLQRRLQLAAALTRLIAQPGTRNRFAIFERPRPGSFPALEH